MKKIIALLLTALMLSALSLTAFADLSALPLETNADINCEFRRLSANVKTDSDVEIAENEFLVIPKGKKLTVANGKRLTLNGRLYIEKGGSLVISSGQLIAGGNSSVYSDGSISVGKKGTLSIMENCTFIVSPKGSLRSKGSLFASLHGSCVACLGRYSGELEGIGTEVISAVSFFDRNSFEKVIYEDFEVYSGDEAKALFPTDLTLSDDQYNPVGGAGITVLRLFCGNGQTIRIHCCDVRDGKHIVINGMHFMLND